ncbi:MAG: serine/threonine protein kinase, partial [Leptolyngbya sp.]|nr:serine/threonine protein kinase [Candidatus Melainabacteria bacterium]
NKDLVIIKEAALPPTLSDVEKAKAEELFQREARLLLKLDHPQIARILDHFLENGRDYLVIEFVPGHTLRQMVTKRGPLDETQAIGLILQLAGVLEYLHTQSPGVLHRDISPDNLILRDDGKLVVIDFGAANEIVGTVTGTIIGKQSYMSPEQFKGKPTAQSDLYSAGCTLHYLLTGQDPKPLTTSLPQLLRQSVSDSCNQLVSDLTQLKPAQRIQSAEVIIERIEELRATPKDVSGTVIEVGKAS